MCHVFLSVFHRAPTPASLFRQLKPPGPWTSHGTVGRFWSSLIGNADRACCATAPLLWTGWTLKPTKLCWQPAVFTSAPSFWTRKMLCIWTSAMQQAGSRLTLILWTVFVSLFLYLSIPSQHFTRIVVKSLPLSPLYRQTYFISHYGCRFGSGPGVYVHSQTQFKSTEHRGCAGSCYLSSNARNCKCLLCVSVNGKSSSFPCNTGFCNW